MEKFGWEAFFKEWKEKHGISVFCKDGIICPQKYEEVLFVLKDVNNAKPEEDIDLRTTLQTRTDEGKTWFDIAAWAAALLDAEIVEKMTHDLQHRYMRRVSVMNIKKEAGGSAVADSLIKTYAQQHKKEILTEIKACHPKIIIACSTVVFETLVENIFGEDKTCSGNQIVLNEKMSKYGRYCDVSGYLDNDDPVYLVEYRHPNQCGRSGTRKEHCENMIKIRNFAFRK